MQIIGLAGPARSGKDTIANHLRKAHGFEVFSFSDKLYDEVSTAFDVPQSMLRDEKTKDSPNYELLLDCCSDMRFIEVAEQLLWRAEPNKADAIKANRAPWRVPLSPRWVLQTWGTEYRRAQNPDYWVNLTSDWLISRLRAYWTDVPHFRAVNTSVRYPNEAEWLRDVGAQIWHVSRKDCPLVRAHSSEAPVPVHEWDNTIQNDGSITSLWSAVTLLVNSHAYGQTIRVEHEETVAP